MKIEFMSNLHKGAKFVRHTVPAESRDVYWVLSLEGGTMVARNVSLDSNVTFIGDDMNEVVEFYNGIYLTAPWSGY
jgi:hypothetical protein